MWYCGCSGIMEDILSVVMSLCDRGSDYKSWTLVCKVWLVKIQKAFCVPRITFGNKIINIIEDTGILNALMKSKLLKITLLENSYVPQSWKDANISYDCKKVGLHPHQDLETMIKIHDQTGEKFSARMMFYRPFPDDQSFIDFCSILSNNLRIMKHYSERYYHPSISLKALQESRRYFEVSWCTIPITHREVLTADDWIMLTDNGCIDPQGTSITRKTDYYTLTSWVRYPTTTLEMILSKIPSSYNHISWIVGLMISCPNCSHHQVVDAIIESGMIDCDFSLFDSSNRISISNIFSAAVNLVTREFW